MPEYILPSAGPAFDNLDEFTRGYIEALFFTETEPGTTRQDRMTTRWTVRKSWGRDAAEGRHHDMPGDYGPDDLAPAALERIAADCAAFQNANSDLLALAYARDYDAAQAGRDYWFTRNGHGVGYWDRDALKASDDDTAEYERLTSIMVENRDNPAAWNKALEARKIVESRGLGERLTEAAGRHGVDAYVGDDGKVYVS